MVNSQSEFYLFDNLLLMLTKLEEKKTLEIDSNTDNDNDNENFKENECNKFSLIFIFNFFRL